MQRIIIGLRMQRIMNEYIIIPLPKEEWKGTPIMMRYTTEEYYDLEKTESGFSLKAINTTVGYTFE